MPKSSSDTDHGAQSGESTVENTIDADIAGAKTVALRLLTHSPRTRLQLRNALIGRGITEVIASEVVDRLEELKLLDDGDYAREFARTKRDLKGWSRQLIERELRCRGVIESDIERACDEITVATDEYSVAKALAAKRLSTSQGLSWATRVRRLSGFLSRKGYDGELVARVVHDVLDEEAKSALT